MIWSKAQQIVLEYPEKSPSACRRGSIDGSFEAEGSAYTTESNDSKDYDKEEIIVSSPGRTGRKQYKQQQEEQETVATE